MQKRVKNVFIREVLLINTLIVKTVIKFNTSFNSKLKIETIFWSIDANIESFCQ